MSPSIRTFRAQAHVYLFHVVRNDEDVERPWILLRSPIIFKLYLNNIITTTAAFFLSLLFFLCSSQTRRTGHLCACAGARCVRVLTASKNTIWDFFYRNTFYECSLPRARIAVTSLFSRTEQVHEFVRIIKFANLIDNYRIRNGTIMIFMDFVGITCNPFGTCRAHGAQDHHREYRIFISLFSFAIHLLPLLLLCMCALICSFVLFLH